MLLVSVLHMIKMNRRWQMLSAAVAGLLGLGMYLGFAAAPADEEHPAPAGEVLNFALIDHHGQLHELRRLGGKAVVLFFTANDCPIARQTASKLSALREKY